LHLDATVVYDKHGRALIAGPDDEFAWSKNVARSGGRQLLGFFD
jgi:hypothetical protein